MQKVLWMSTNRSSIRDECNGWGYNDGNAVRDAFVDRLGTKYEYAYMNDIPVGLVRSWSPSSGQPPRSYPTVLHALADGWKLLAPPTKYKEGSVIQYEWWLVKD